MDGRALILVPLRIYPTAKVYHNAFAYSKAHPLSLRFIPGVVMESLEGHEQLAAELLIEAYAVVLEFYMVIYFRS